MKVAFVYRKPAPDAFSIEEIFHTVACELDRKVEGIEFEVGNRSRHLWDACRLRRLGADVYHVTGDVNYFVLLLPRRRTVLTVHDIGHYLHDLRGVRRWLYKWLWLVLPIRRAAIVTAVSEETRGNVVRHLGIGAERIHVVEDCYRPIFRPAPRPFNETQPVVLQVGTKHNKNVPRLIEALRGLDVRLVLIGRLDAVLKGALKQCGIDYESHSDISSEELYQRYVDCDLVSFVSTGEGFGMPIIEAQAVGRPVITADVPPMPDVAGKGACLVNPLDVEAIRDGIRRILDDPAYRDRLVEDGFENVGRFSAAAISAQYEALYNRVLAASAEA